MSPKRKSKSQNIPIALEIFQYYDSNQRGFKDYSGVSVEEIKGNGYISNCIWLNNICVNYEKRKRSFGNNSSSFNDYNEEENASNVLEIDSFIPLNKLNGDPIRTALIGESGSGKTTLVNLLLGNIVPKEGSVSFPNDKGKDVPLCYKEKFLREHRASIGIVSQGLNGTVGYLSLLENAARPALLRGDSSREAEAKAEQALEEVGLDARLWDRFPNQVSGGELQRALIAKTIVQKPRFLICDEPTSALDRPNAKLVVEAIMRTNVPTLIVTHDPALIAPYMDGISLLYNGDLLDITFLQKAPILRTFSSVSDLYNLYETYKEEKIKKTENSGLNRSRHVLNNENCSRS